MPSYPSSSVAPSNGGYSTGSPSHVTVYKSSVPPTHPTSTKVNRMDSAEFPGEASPSSVFPLPACHRPFHKPSLATCRVQNHPGPSLVAKRENQS